MIIALLGLTAAIATPLPSPAQEQAETIGEWTLRTIVDPITDEGRMVATLKTGEDTLAVKCDTPGPRSVYIHWIASEYLGGRGGRFGSRPMTYRFDQSSPVTESWAYDGRSAIQTDSRRALAFVQALSASERVVLRGSDYRGSEKTAIFTAVPADTARVVARVYETCRDGGLGAAGPVASNN